MGRSYGDVCLNNGGTLLRTSGLDQVLAFDAERGLITVQAGATLDAVLNHVIPHGWFLPVLPGTRHVTVGGAIANDIHGKNHHRAGSFGHHVSQLELFRQGALVSCSPATNAPLFAATIGGLGLTGMITQAELHLKRISSTTIDTQRVAVRTIEEMHDVLTSADEEYDYTVAWLDVGTERGICLLGNHAHTGPLDTLSTRTLPVPRFAGAFLNDVTLTIFNRAYYTAQVIGGKQRRMRTEQFFFPLDSIRDWNEFYGRSGFLQYQFVVPFAGGVASVRKILETLRKHHITTYLSVFKLFGSALANGLMSFPMPGITVALDVPNTGKPLLAALDMCDQLVLDAGGRVYPAKDARMSPLTFQRMYGHALAEFNSHRDPQFSSSFWRRVMGEGS